MANIKIVVTGPFGAGKTTLIKTISEVTVLSTERDISDHTKDMKPATTVAMDFGRITIDQDLVLYLFGTPGQERFDFMWEILAEGMLGFVLIVDKTRPDSLDEAKRILEAFRGYGPAPLVVGVNKHDPLDPNGDVESTRQALGLSDSVPVLPINALERASVKDALLALLYTALEEVERADAVATA